MLAGFITLVIGEVLDNQTLKNGIDWPFLLFIGIAFSFVKVLDQLGIVGALTVEMKTIMKPFTATLYLFLPALTVVIFIISFIVMTATAPFFFSTNRPSI